MYNLTEDMFLQMTEAIALKTGMELLIEKTKKVNHDPEDQSFKTTLAFFQFVFQKWDKISRSTGLHIDPNGKFYIKVSDLGKAINCN